MQRRKDSDVPEKEGMMETQSDGVMEWKRTKKWQNEHKWNEVRDFHASSESFQAHMFPPEGKVLSGHLQHTASAQPTAGYLIIAARNVPGHKLIACANTTHKVMEDEEKSVWSCEHYMLSKSIIVRPVMDNY